MYYININIDILSSVKFFIHFIFKKIIRDFFLGVLVIPLLYLFEITHLEESELIAQV